MKRIFVTLVLFFALALVLTGCTTSQSVIYKVETGDQIKVKLNTSNGYELSTDVPFTISKDDEVLSQAIFITNEGYEQYIDLVNSDSKAEILDSGNEKGISYTFYSYNDSEFNYVIKVDDSKTGILLGNPNSKEEAEDIFNRLKFSLEK